VFVAAEPSLPKLPQPFCTNELTPTTTSTSSMVMSFGPPESPKQ